MYVCVRVSECVCVAVHSGRDTARIQEQVSMANCKISSACEYAFDQSLGPRFLIMYERVVLLWEMCRAFLKALVLCSRSIVGHRNTYDNDVRQSS